MATGKKAKAKVKRKSKAAKRPVARKKTRAVRKTAAKKKPVVRRVVRKKKAKKPAPRRAPAPKARPARKPSKPAAKPAKPAIPAIPAVPPLPAAPAPMAGEDRVGFVTHYYGHLSVASVMIDTLSLRVGDTIHVVGHTSDFRQRVESMQIEHEAVSEALPGQEIGLKVTEHAREHDVVYKVPA
jgi:hypothetical protein